MKDNKVVELAALIFIAVFVLPVVIGGAITIINVTYAGIANTVNKVKFNKKMEKGLKDGSIIKIDKDYYEVGNVEEA